MATDNGRIRYEHDVPIACQADVLVIGGGPAGIGAALAAARAGAETVLVEQYGFLGGAATAGLVGPFMTTYSGDGDRQVVAGIFDELIRRMESIGGATHSSQLLGGAPEAGYYRFGHAHVTPFDPEALKLVAAEMMVESGVQLWLHTRFVDPIMEDTWLRGAIVHTKSGLQAIAAKLTIDCSADAEVAYRAGAPTVKGRESDGLTQPMTMFFRIGNVDDNVVDAWIKDHPEEQGRLFHGIVSEATARGEFRVNRDKFNIYRTAQKGVWRVNTSRLQALDGTKAVDLTTAEIEGRRQVWHLVEFARTHLPGFEKVVLIDTATQIGVRETRRIVGEYVLNYDDLHTGRHFPDGIALGGFPIDLHPETGSGGGTDTGLARELTTASVYEVPYRSLVPQGVEQLLVAGRCLSADREAMAAARIMPICCIMGQAAGVAGATAVADEVSPRDVDVAKVQEILREQGAVLNM
ncbi:MAG: FAD-dependent oxidoreductase [Alphaproteobacteria bacterium]